MTEPLEDIEFLARSHHRVRALDALAGGPHSRRELRETTGASQPTMTRVLRDLEARGWVEHEDGRYAATPLGELVADGVDELVTAVETDHRLGDIVGWLPTDRLDVDLRRFHDATVTRPTQTDPSKPLKRALELTAGADDHRILSYALNRDMIDALHGATVEGTQTFRAVVPAETVAPLRDAATLWRRFRAVAEADGVTLRVAADPVPFAMGIADRTVYFFLRDDAEVLRAVVETTDATVHSWAERTFDAYWDDAGPLDIGSVDSAE